MKPIDPLEAASSSHKQGWQPPTRRTFVHMLAAAAAALAVKGRAPKPPPLWIGHF